MAELIRCLDVWGRTVVLFDGTWYDKIIVGHSIMEGNEDTIESVLANPDIVTQDVDHENGVNYHLRGALPPPDDEFVLKVCVCFEERPPGGERLGIVVAAYPVIRLKRREKVLWTPRTR